MARSLSRTCYKILEKLSILCILISCISIFTTAVVSCLLKESQIVTLTDILSTLTSVGFYGAIALTAFMVGAKYDQHKRERTEQEHAAILQAATRRKLSLRHPRPESVWKTAEIPRWTPPQAQTTSPPRTRGRTTHPEFDDNADDNIQW